MANKTSKNAVPETEVHIDGIYRVIEQSSCIKKDDPKEKLFFYFTETYHTAKTGYSHRLINYLADKGMLNPDCINNQGNWKKFSFRDLLYFAILQDFRDFGVSYKKLYSVHRLFYQENSSIDEAVLACLSGVETTLSLKSSGNCSLQCVNQYSRTELASNPDNEESVIRMFLNYQIRKTLESIKEKPEEVFSMFEKAVTQTVVTESEQQVLNALRNNDYLEVKVSKEDNELNTLYLQDARVNNPKLDEVIDLILKQNYGNIIVQKKDGHIVSARSEQTIKL